MTGLCARLSGLQREKTKVRQHGNGVAIAYAMQMIPALSLNADSVIAFFVGFAMPTAGLASAFSDQYDGDTDNAVIFTLGTTVLSVVTIPVLYWVLRLFV